MQKMTVAFRGTTQILKVAPKTGKFIFVRTFPNTLLSWPYGTYSLLAGIECPPGFEHGFIGQDTQDNSDKNAITPGSPESLLIDVNNEGVMTHYCTKTLLGDQNADGLWPAGKYCIAQYGASCPNGFSLAPILWDDEDDRNRNSNNSKDII